MAAYQWKAGARMSGDAQKVGEALARLERKGRLTPDEVVKSAKRSDSVLHQYFEWDDAAAAVKYREVQAGNLIRAVEVVVEGSSEPVRAFVNVVTEGGERKYMDVEAALSEQPTRDQVLADAIAELRAFEKKYAGISELAEVIDAIRKVA